MNSLIKDQLDDIERVIKEFENRGGKEVHLGKSIGQNKFLYFGGGLGLWQS